MHRGQRSSQCVYYMYGYYNAFTSIVNFSLQLFNLTVQSSKKTTSVYLFLYNAFTTEHNFFGIVNFSYTEMHIM